MWTSCYISGIFFRSPDLKGQVSYCRHLTSVRPSVNLSLKIFSKTTEGFETVHSSKCPLARLHIPTNMATVNKNRKRGSNTVFGL